MVDCCFPINSKCRLFNASGRCGRCDRHSTKLSYIVLQTFNSTNELTILPFSAAADISVCTIMCGFLDYIMTSYASGNIKQVSNLSTYPCSAVFHSFVCGFVCQFWQKLMVRSLVYQQKLKVRCERDALLKRYQVTCIGVSITLYTYL